MSDPTPLPKPRRRRLRRTLWTAVLVLVVLPVLIVLGVMLSLRAAGVRQAILARVSAMAGQYGLEVKAEDFSPLWSFGGIELRNVRAGAPGAAPVATARRVRVQIDIRSLRERPLVVNSLLVEGLRIDLNAPFPRIPESPSEAGSGPPVVIRQLVLRGGQVQGAPLAKPAADWVRSWSARNIEAEGWYSGGQLDLKVGGAEATLDRPGFGRQNLWIEGHVNYEEGKPLRLRSARVATEGLNLFVSGLAGLAPEEPTDLRFNLLTDLRALVADVPRDGFLDVMGQIKLPEIEGQMKVKATRVPAEVLKPYLDAKLYTDLNLAGTVADVNADAVVGPGDWNRVTGTAEAVWRRGERRFVRAEARLSAPIVATVEAEILPGSPGRRAVQGTVRAASWAEMAKATAEGVRAEVRLPDVRAAFAEARSLWPRLVPALPQEIPLQGSLTADVRASGSLAAPDAVVNATWLPQAGSLVRVEAKGKALAWSGSAKVRTEALPLSLLAAFAPGLSGTVTGTADVSGSPRAYRTRVEAATADLSYPPALQGLATGTVRADGTVVPRPLSYRGKLSVEGAGLVSSPSASGTARVERFALAGDGRLQASPLRWEGALTLNAEGAGMEGVASAERVEAVADGTLTVEPLTYDGTLSLDGTGVEAPGTSRAARVDRLRVSSQGKLAADLQSLAAQATVDADRVALTESGTEIRNLHLEADANGPEVRISSLSGELPEGRTFNATGRVVTEPLLAEADLDLRLVNPVDAVAAADLTARLRNGVVEVDATRLETASGPGSLKARVPLGTLAQMPQLAEALASLPGQKAMGPVSLSLAFPEVDSEPLLAVLGLEPRPERVRAGVTADLSLDPTAPAAGTGEVRLAGLTLETPDGRVTAEGPAVLRLGEGRLILDPVHLRIDGGAVQGAGVDLQASADLARSWRPLEDPVASAVTGVSARGSGTIDAALLNPYLQGGAAEGTLAFEATASGPPDRLAAHVEASGPGAAFVWPTAGAQIEDPRLALDLQDGRWKIRAGRMEVNGGTVDLAGGFSTEGGLDVEATLAKVRYRLDYGIDTLLSGNLTLKAPPEGRSRLSGEVVVERGVLDRNVNLDREVFTLLFKPEDTPGTEESALAAVDLDLRIETRDGVRVRNNVGDLRASWDELRITGTLENPVIRGRIDVDPGGLLYAYGQNVRIDRGSFLFTGDPLTDPEIDLATTSSLQDPTIARLRGGSLLDLLPTGDEEDEYEDPGEGEERARTERAQTQEILGAGLTGYYGARVVERLGESIGLGGFSVRPELDLEQDPSARLTVGQDLSRNVSLALSIDLRNAERQTYLLYLQEIRALPGLRIEGLSNDEGREAASLQQVFDFSGGGGGGGTVRREETGPRLRRIDISTPKGGVSKRQIRRAIQLEKKRPVPEGVEFGTELDVAELLRRRRYPDPRITVKSSTPRPGWVDLAVTVEPGPRISFVFEGDRPPRALRPEITELYRTDFYEPISIEEMKREAVRAFRGTGHVDPRIAIEVRRERPDDPDGPRTVTIRSEAGPRRSLEELRIAGLGAEEERLVAAAFPGTLARAELAAGEANADRRLLLQLRALGYPDARIATRFVKGDGSRLVVGVEPGPRQTLARIEIQGVEDGERQRLLGLVPLRTGDPARLDLIAQGTREIEADLRDRGFADAVVRSETTTAGRPEETSVVFAVTPGPWYRLAGVDIAGERGSRPALLLREADLDVGEPFRQEDVEEARSRLFRTGVFSRVDAEVEKDGTPGDAANPGETAEARVTFSIAERPRFRFGYGVRWESEEGTGAVVDFVDQNFLGRAMTFGLRGLYQEDDRSGRLYLRTGGILGTEISLESYAEGRRQIFTADNLIEDRREAALQASRPIGRADTARLYARYRTTRVFEIEPNPFVPFESETRLPLLGVQLLRDTRDDPIDPSRGLFASLDLSGSDTFLGSDFQFLRLFAQASSFRGFSLAGRRWTWAQAVRLGLAQPFAGQEVIRSERFFAGGPYSVRGYEMESLGPREVLGDIIDRPLGGEALFILNQEIRVPLPWDLTGLVFFDAGQVWARPGDADFDLATSLGLGLRARTPLGLLRLDAAYPFDRRPGEASYRVYVGFGNAF